MRRYLLLALFLLPLPSLLAQTTLGSSAVSGVVRDASGATVQGCKVVLVETARGLSRETFSNDAGAFLFPTVSAGLYSLTVSKPSFETYQLNDVRVDVGQRATLDVVLKVGVVSSVVSVSAGSRVLLETESNAIGTVVDSARVEGLPLNGRNYLQLATLAGGANAPSGNSNNIGNQIGHPDRGVILAGNMPQTTGYVINGIATRGGRLGESALNLSVADIDQFKVQQSFFMPDQGPDPALVNVTTKGGGNQFHGQAFEFVRNERFDARNFFAPTPEHLKRNQFGGALGGPIRKDKIWFYGYYEELRQLQAFSSSAYAPTAAMFRGDLSALLPKAIYDPATLSADASARLPFAGNIIPSNRINQVSTNLLKYYLPGSSLAQRPVNLFGNPRNTLDDDQWGIRLDASLTAGQTLFGQFIHQNAPANQPGLFPLSGALFPNSSDLIMLQHTWTISPRFINTVRAGFTRSVALNGNEGSAVGHILGEIGITNTLDDRGVVGVGIQGYASFGHGAGDLGNLDNNYQLDEGMNWVRGSHNFQFGGSIRYRRTWQQNANASAVGGLSFQPLLTAQLTTNAQRQTVPLANTGDSFADFLLGYAASATVNGLPRLPYRFIQYMPYFADTWRISPTFTLNYGISWFLATVPTPQKWARQWPHSFDPATGLLTYSALGQIDPAVLAFDKNNLAPRLGVAWSPSFLPHTVIRAGGGFYYSDLGLIEMQFDMAAPPFTNPFTLTQPQTNPVPQYQLGRNVFPAFSLPPLSASFAAGVANGSTAFLLNPGGRTPYIAQWNYSMQHTFGNNDLLQLDYLGSSGHRVQNRYQANQCRPGSDLFCSPATVPYPRYASLLTSDFNSNISYEALVTRYEHRAAAGLNLRVEYTFGKAMIDTGWEGGGNQSQIASCRRCDKAPASFNVAHRAVASAIYDLPFGRRRALGRNMSRALDLVAGGWTVTAITSFATGVPVSLSAANTTAASNITTRPNRVCAGGSSDLLSNLRTNGFLAFDPSCFAAPAVGYYGNSGRNPVTGPGVNNWDLGFQKYFTLREPARLEFRAEMFNAFNHAQFGQPNANVANGANFGRISSAAAPRLVQLGMKLLF